MQTPQAITTPQTVAAQTIALQTLRAVHAFARAQLERGVGDALLAAHQLDHPLLIEVYQIGFVPANFADVLSQTDKVALGDYVNALQDVLIIPAYDQDEIVDFLLIADARASKPITNLLQQPAGVFAPQIELAYDEVTSVNDLAALRASFDAQQLHVRLHRTALLQDTHQTTAVQETADAAGAICPTSTTSADQDETDQGFQLVHMNRMQSEMTCLHGDFHYSVEIPADVEQSTLAVTVRHKTTAKIHRDRFNLLEPKQCERFARIAARVCGQDPDASRIIIADLTACWQELEAHFSESQRGDLRTMLSMSVRDKLQDYQQDPNVTVRIAKDLTALGWPGDDRLKILCYLSLLSRKCKKPVWLCIHDDTAVESPLGILARLLPGHERLDAGIFQGAALRHLDKHALKQSGLIIDRATPLKKEHYMTLRLLRERGGLSVAESERDPDSGAWRSCIEERKGPVALIWHCDEQAKSNCEREQLQALCLQAAFDHSPSQQAQALNVMYDEFQGITDGAAVSEQQQLIASHKALLADVPTELRVHIPFAKQLRTSLHGAQVKPFMQSVLTLIQASAYLHRVHRRQVDGVLHANAHDFRLVQGLMHCVLSHQENALSIRAAQALQLIAEDRLETISGPALQTYFPSWTRHQARHVIKELVQAEFIATEKSSHNSGRRAKQYAILEHAYAAADGAGESVLLYLQDKSAQHKESVLRVHGDHAHGVRDVQNAQNARNNDAHISDDDNNTYVLMA